MSITWTTWFCVRQAAETCEYFVIDKLCLGVSRCPYTKFWGRVLCALASVSGTISRPRIVRYINRCRCRRRLMPIVLLTSRLATPPVTHRSTGFTILWRNLYCFLAATTHQDWFNAFFRPGASDQPLAHMRKVSEGTKVKFRVTNLYAFPILTTRQKFY